MTHGPDARRPARPTRPFFSVILPCHGREEPLRRALRSVLAQTETDWEVVVADDASPRPLAPVVEAFGDARIRCIRLERNGGPGAAREAALRAARGRFAAFLDSDDVWRPDALARQRRRCAQGPARVVIAGAEVERDGRRTARPERASRPGERIASYLFVSNQYAQISGVVAPTRLARRVGFGGLRQYEDWYFLIRAEALGAEVVATCDRLVLRPDDGLGDRQGACDDVDRAETFLAAAEPWLLPSERSGFVLRCLGPALSRRDAMRAARLAVAALLRGAGPRPAALKLLVRSAMGDRSYRGCRLLRESIIRMQARLERRPGWAKGRAA